MIYIFFIKLFANWDCILLFWIKFEEVIICFILFYCQEMLKMYFTSELNRLQVKNNFYKHCIFFP